MGTLPFDFYQPIDPPRAFQILAHRGMMRQAPENTAGALQRCIEQGVEWAEVDVRLTRDGHHVLFHDSRLDGKTGATGSVRDYTLAELLALDAGAKFSPEARGTRLLTAAQALALSRGGLNLCFDCKNADPELLAREIRDAGMERQVVVFDKVEALRRVRAASGGAIPIMPKWRTPFGLTTWVDEVGPEVVEINADELTPEVARAFHDRGIIVQVKVLGHWDTPEVWNQVLDAGADWLQTDRPEELVAHKRRAPSFSLSGKEITMHLAYETLEQALRELPPLPADEGSVVMVVARPEEGARLIPERCPLTPEGGVEGDRWGHRKSSNPLSQITVMRADVARLFANGQPLSIFGDNLLVELDLSNSNLPAGTRLRVGTALCEVTTQPHTGCIKFAARVGEDARNLTAAPAFGEQRLRGLHFRVLEPGEVGPGDPIRVLSRPKR
jgi:glycerophosphoryl diester phosphodiesterase